MGKNKSENSEKPKPIEIIALPPERIKSEIILPAISAIAKRRDSNFLVMYYPNNVSMTPMDVSIVRLELTKADSSKPIDLFIHSGGGDIHTAYKLAKLCQKYFKKSEVRALIPEYAKSAATLLAIGCKNIEMSSIAELGPLDPIIFLNEDTPVPAFAIRESTKTLEKEIEECENEEIRKLKAEFILGPIAAKIDPYLLSATKDIPSLAILYGKRLLTAIGHSTEEAERILRRLTFERGRPSHGYVVDVDEAKEVRLKAKEMNEKTEEECLGLLMFLRKYEKSLAAEGHPLKTPFIHLVSLSKAKKR